MRLILLALLVIPAAAQEDRPAPKTARQVCERLEESMESSYRLTEQVGKAIMETEDAERRKEAFRQLEAIEERFDKDQLAWQRLGCVQILYPPGNDRP